jgi:hypothetical protein
VAVILLAILTALAWTWIVQPLRNRAHFAQCLRETLAEPHTLKIHTLGDSAPALTHVPASSPLWQPLHEALPHLPLYDVQPLDSSLGCMGDYVIFEIEGRRAVYLSLCSDTVVTLGIRDGAENYAYRGRVHPEEIARLRRILPKEMTYQPGQFDAPEDEK